jgi:hypothetical protein
MWVKLRHYGQADSSYQAAERRALDAGEDRAALLAAIKRVSLCLAIGQRARARRMIDEIEARPVAIDPVMKAVIAVIRFRMAARDASDEEVVKLAGEIRQSQGMEPALLWAPSFPTDATVAANTDARKFGLTDAFPNRTSDIGGIQWIDVGFWIRPDGHTAEMEVLRRSKTAPWSEQMLAQIGGRRYASSSQMASETTAAAINGVYRVERITRRSTYDTPTGSLIRRRITDEGFEILALTDTGIALK